MNTKRELILAVDDVKRETVYVPQWDVTIEVRSMTANQRAMMIRKYYDPVTKIAHFDYGTLVIVCSYDPDTGQPIFEEQDAALLNEKNGEAVELIAGAALKVSGMSESAAADMEKNSGGMTPAEG